MANNEKGLPTPIPRKEKFLAKAAGMDVEIPKAITREEMYLEAIANGGGGGGFTPTQSQLDAMNSGITAEDVEQIITNKNNILSCKEFTDNASIDSNRKLYISAIEPTGEIPQGSTWINGKEIKSYERTNNLSDGIFTHGGIYDAGGLNVASNRVRIYVDVTAGQTYSFGSNKYIRTIYGYSGDWSYAANRVELIVSASSPADTTYTFTIPSGVSGVGIALCNVDNSDIAPTDINNFMFNEGSTLLPYEPYLYWQ